MKKRVLMVVLIVCLATMSLTTTVLADTGKKGAGVEGFLNSCIIGPRIGIEMNEGQTVSTMEYLQYIMIVPVVGVVGLIPRVILAAEAGEKNGIEGFLAGCCIGPRVGKELDQRKIRITEWIRLIPIVSIVPAVIHGVEAYNGKTMKEIEQQENLGKK